MTPRQPAVVLALVIVAGLLAGCLGTSDAPGPGTSPPAPGNATDSEGDPAQDPIEAGDTSTNATGNATRTARVRYTGCTLMQSVYVVPGAVAPQMPDGFTPAAPGYPGLLGTAATIVVDGHVCDNATVGQATIADVLEMHVYVLVDPPDRFETQAIGAYAVEVAGVVREATLHDVYRSWNLSAVDDGDIQATMTRTASAVEQGQMTVDSANLSLQLRTATEGQGSDLSGYRSRTFTVADGEVVSIVDVNITDGTQTTGVAKIVDSGVPSDPGQAQPWLVANALETGFVAHQSIDRTWIHRDPAALG